MTEKTVLQKRARWDDPDLDREPGLFKEMVLEVVTIAAFGGFMGAMVVLSQVCRVRDRLFPAKPGARL